MRKLHICFVVLILLFFTSNGYAAPRRKRATPSKPALTWVKDNARLFTTEQADNLDATIQSMKDSVKTLPNIYIVTQSDRSAKSPFFISLKSQSTPNKWYVSGKTEYANDLVITVFPRGKDFESPQLNILYDKTSPSIQPFLSPAKTERLQNEYNKFLNDMPDKAASEIITKLVHTLRSRFFDGQVRDYGNNIKPIDKTEIERLIRNFRDSTTIKVAVVTSPNSEGEDSAFGHASNNSDSKQPEMTVEYKNLNADIVFAFYPKGVNVFSSLSKEKLSDKAVQNLISDFLSPQAKTGKYKEAIKVSLAALSDHLRDEKPLDGMSLWEKLATALLGIGIPSVFGILIFKNSSKKKETTVAHHKPHTHKPEPEHKPVANHPTASKPEKKEEKIHTNHTNHTKPAEPLPAQEHLNALPPLTLTKPDEAEHDRGWTLDNTGSLPVTMSRIDDLFKPISPRNGHEKIMLEMIGFMLSLRQYTDQDISHSLGKQGISVYLDELYACVDPAAVRIVFTRGIDLLLKNYAERDPRVGKYISTPRR